MEVIAKKRVVCFGGGTGMPSLLSGLKQNPLLEVSAVVNMFDTGGSSGALKDRFGILPPGDVLKCLLALAEDEAAARKILLKRISHPTSPDHTGGNLLLLALEQVYKRYPDAISALGQILSVKGSVHPVTLGHATLCARSEDGATHRGETTVDASLREGKKIVSLFLEPDVDAADDALQAIVAADAFCVGPGSFYTSVLPNFLPVGVRDAVTRSRAPIIYIANLLTEGDGMDGKPLASFVEIAERLMGRRVQAIIVNACWPHADALEAYAREGKRPLRPSSSEQNDPRLFLADLWTDASIARHDSSRLAAAVFAVMNRL